MSSKIIFLVVFTLCGCVSNTAGVRPSKWVDDFYHTSTSEQINQFKNHTLDEQYELFMFGNQVVHPPATYLALPFAQQGATIIPFLRGKLGSEINEARIRDIALVFSEVARLKLYDFKKDTALMSLLNKKVNNMQGIWENVTLESLKEIQSMGTN